jgi:serine-threonine kinase receptor-associated protein
MAYLAATASGDFSVKVWDAITGECFQTFQQGHVVKTVDWSKDSRYLATGGHEGILRVYDLLNVQQDPIAIRQCGEMEVRYG